MLLIRQRLHSEMQVILVKFNLKFEAVLHIRVYEVDHLRFRILAMELLY